MRPCIALFARSGRASPRTHDRIDPTAPTIDDIRAAAARIDGAIEKTPTSHSGVLSKMIGADLWLKFENLQYTAAYKERGALNKLLQLTDDERAPRGDRRLGRQPCPGGRLSWQAPRHSGDHRHAQSDPDGEGHPDRGPQARASCFTARRSTTPTTRRARWRRRRRLVFVHPFDDPQDHRRRRHHRARNARRGARSRRAGRADRRRRADQRHGDRRQDDQSRDRDDRGRGRALPVDEECRRRVAAARSAATRWRKGLRSRSRAS